MATAVFPVMEPGAYDALQQLIVKAAYWAQSLAESGGSITMAGPYPIMTPGANDPIQMAAVKLAWWLERAAGSGGGGGSGLTFSTGSGSPEGVVTGSPGDTYWDTANDFYYIKVTGTATNTGWMVH